MARLLYLSAQPVTDYYAWQVAVMLRSFLKHGVRPERIHVVGALQGGPFPRSWRQVVNHFRGVRFFWYDDERECGVLPTTVRPHVLAKHWDALPELEQEAVLWHDCDIVLTRPPDWDHLADGPVWQMSDTRSYVGVQYIRSKGEDVYEGMCNVMGLCPKVPEARDAGAGGAQVIMKNVTADYWLAAEQDIQALHDFFRGHLQVRPETDDYHPIQKWTAGMWATLWGAWRAGHDTAIAPELAFCWPTDPARRWDEVGIYHNAGVTAKRKHLFAKTDHRNRPPWGISNQVDPKWASHRYVEEILATGREMEANPKPRRPCCGEAGSTDKGEDMADQATTMSSAALSRFEFEAGHQESQNRFTVLYGALTSGPPVQDRQEMRVFMRLADKLERISEVQSVEVQGKPSQERILTPGAPHHVDMDSEEVAFLVKSLDALISRCPRTWLPAVSAAYESIGEEK